MDDDEDEWSPHVADFGSISQLTDRPAVAKKPLAPMGFLDFSRLDFGVKVQKEWTTDPPPRKPRFISLPKAPKKRAKPKPRSKR